MNVVYLLWWVRELDKTDDTELLIGVYETEAAANAAIERLRTKPGFVDFTEGFQIHSRELDQDQLDGWICSGRVSQMIERLKRQSCRPLGAVRYRPNWMAIRWLGCSEKVVVRYSKPI